MVQDVRTDTYSWLAIAGVLEHKVGSKADGEVRAQLAAAGEVRHRAFP
jgi:hypothetical protein